MRRLIRRPQARHDDRGAVASLVAVLLAAGVLLGMAALTVDVGQVYAERRQLQNGADAAALAVAMSCSTGTTCDTATSGRAATYADQNANDSAASVLSVCGAGNASLPTCGSSSGPALTQCSAAPSGVGGWVRVRTGTRTAGGSSLLPPTFARALTGNGSSTGTQVLACALATWGSPSGLTQVVPLTIAACEWSAATSGGTRYAPPPPYPPYPSSPEVVLKLHSAGDESDCEDDEGSMPGGFGWLDSGSGCSLAVTTGSTVRSDTGVSAGACTDAVAAQVGKTVFVAVYDRASGTGSKGTYHLMGFAAFYLSGYWLPAAHPNRVASPVGGNLCKGQDKCLYGWFTKALVPPPVTIGPGPGAGAQVVALTG